MRCAARRSLPLLLALLAGALLPPAPAGAAGTLLPDRFGISEARRGRLFLSHDRATPGFERLAEGLVLHSPDGAIGPGRSVKVETPDGRTGYVEGRFLAPFDRRGLYLADLAARTVRRVRGIRGDCEILAPNPKRAFVLERESGRLFAVDPRDGTSDLLFPGDGPADLRRLLTASPDGRFVVFHALPAGGAEPVTRLLDAQTRDVVIIPPCDEAPLSWGNGARILAGPFPGDGRVSLHLPGELVRDMKARAGDPRTWAGGAKPAVRDAALSPCGTRWFRLLDDFHLEVFDAATDRPVYDALDVGAARFLPDGRMMIRRTTGFTLVSRDGRTLGGPWFGGSPRDLPVFSRDGRVAMLVSKVGADERFRAAIDLPDGRMIHPVADGGGDPILLRPRLLPSGRALLADGYRVDLAAGIAWRDGRLDGFLPERLSPHADLFLHIDRNGIHRLIEPSGGAEAGAFPFPGGFVPVFTPDPCLLFLVPADPPRRRTGRTE